MERHPAFPGIRLHSDSELAEVLGAGIVERQTIHEWPLSCVQRVVLEGGRKLIYKAQLPPTVEPAFYKHAVSSLLTNHRSFLGSVSALGSSGAGRAVSELSWADLRQMGAVAAQQIFDEDAPLPSKGIPPA